MGTPRRGIVGCSHHVVAAAVVRRRAPASRRRAGSRIAAPRSRRPAGLRLAAVDRMPIRHRSVRMLAIAALASLAACYAVAPLPGSPCVDSDHCPAGQQCVAGSCGGTQTAQLDAGTALNDATGEPPADAAPAASDCASSDRCLTALTLGMVSGDTGHQVLSAHGSRAAWLRVRVTEDDDSFEGIPLHVLARLTPPPGADFDVVLYANPDADIVECTTPIGTPSASGNVKLVRASWGEDVVSDGESDSRDVSIEIRPRSGSCASGAEWQLALEGDWN
jgi:hypothetical protein